jgi:hypothetical protein
MKKIFLLIITIVFLGNNINAQYSSNAQQSRNDFREELLFGIKAGLNYSNVYDTKAEEFSTNPKYGMVAGLFLSIPIGKYLGIQPEILFSQKGFEAKSIILTNEYKYTRTLNYIDLPLLFTIKPVEVLSFMAGPQISYLIKQKNEYADAAQEIEFDNSNIRKNTLSILGGMDLNLTHIVIGARAGWDIQNNNGDCTSTSPRYKNVWYQATLGIRF